MRLHVAPDCYLRDNVRGFGSATGSAQLAQMRLDLGLADDQVNSVELEGEIGYRRIEPGSIEAQFVLSNDPSGDSGHW